MEDVLVKLTNGAVDHVARQLAQNGSAGIRFSIKIGGCQGLTYGVDYVDQADPADVVIEQDGIKIFIEPKAVLFIEGMTVDFKTTPMSSGFTFENPNAVKKCGCGVSFCSNKTKCSDGLMAEGEGCGGKCCG